MARSTKPPSAVRVKLAVHMRRCGSTWRAVGVEVGCSPETVRQWPRIYPREWQAAVRDDVRQSGSQAEGQAVSALRMMINSGNEKVRLRAATSLIDLRMSHKRAEIAVIRAEKTWSGWLNSALTILEGRTHDELKAFGEYCLQLAEEKRNSAQPGSPSAT